LDIAACKMEAVAEWRETNEQPVIFPT
jgi:hypothetical protein